MSQFYLLILFTTFSLFGHSHTFEVKLYDWLKVYIWSRISQPCRNKDSIPSKCLLFTAAQRLVLGYFSLDLLLGRGRLATFSSFSCAEKKFKSRRVRYD